MKTALYSSRQAAAVWRDLLPRLSEALDAGKRYMLAITPERRSVDQNARLWALLAKVSRDIEWYGERLTPEEWKDVFTAALKQQRVVPGIEGGFVVLGAHTAKMSKAELTDLMGLIEAFISNRPGKDQ